MKLLSTFAISLWGCTAEINSVGSTSSTTSQSGCTSIGASCGGGIYAGDHGSQKLIATPGGCNNSTTPTCAGGTDTLSRIYSLQFNNVVGANSNSNGAANTTALVASDGTDAQAAYFCENMTYGGFSDWYLPAYDELQVLYTNRVAIGGFDLVSTDCYWSSTNIDSSSAKCIRFDTGSTTGETKDYSGTWVRCVRKI